MLGNEQPKYEGEGHPEEGLVQELLLLVLGAALRRSPLAGPVAQIDKVGGYYSLFKRHT